VCYLGVVPSIAERAMSFRHLVPIALAWYLLTPPYVGPNRFDAKAPLSKWYEAIDFDSQVDCEHYRAGTIKQYEKKIRDDPVSSRASIELFKAAQCVSSDDPRRAGS